MNNPEPSREINAYEFHPARDLYGGALNAFGQISKKNPWIPEAKKIRELWEVSCFGVGVSLLHHLAVEVRLTDDEPADGQMRIGEQMIDVQTTVRIREGRQPLREYAAKQTFPNTPRVQSPEATEDQAVDWIGQAIEAKERKRYSKAGRPLYLLVYANFRKNGLDMPRLLDRVLEIAPISFDQVWFLSSIISSYDHAYAIAQLYPSGGGFLAYDIGSEKAIPLKELHRPFGPMEIQ